PTRPTGPAARPPGRGPGDRPACSRPSGSRGSVPVSCALPPGGSVEPPTAAYGQSSAGPAGGHGVARPPDEGLARGWGDVGRGLVRQPGLGQYARMDYETALLRFPPHVDRVTAAVQLAIAAEYSGWELSRVRLFRDGTRKV